MEFAQGGANDALIAKAVRDAGYSLGAARRLPWISHDGQEWFEVILGAAGLFLLWLVGSFTGAFSAFGGRFAAAPTYPIVFVIGLTAGISTCMAVVGGLVAGFSASYAEKHQYASRWQRFQPNLFFNAGRLVSYAALGGAIGALGSAVRISANFTSFLVAAAGAVMLYLGLKLTGISPRMSHMSISLPKRLSRLLGRDGQGGDYSHKEAFLGGALTFFLPCGFTQAMQLYAITTGSFVSGAIIMFLFALGTMPGLLGIGALTSLLKGRAGRTFFRFVGIIVLALGIFNLASGMRALGFALPNGTAGSAVSAAIVDGQQVVNMVQSAGGYSPNSFIVKKGVPVKWVIDAQDPYTCSASLRLRDYGIAQFLQPGQNIIAFTPTRNGTVRFTCGMGMFSGTFTVVD